MIYNDYKKFIQKLKECKKNIYKANEVFQNKSLLNKQFIIIKHDVEDKPKKALKLAKIERNAGVLSTYYIHSFFLKDKSNYFKVIQELGHEIGYHYDVLDNNNGDFEKAQKEFEKSINEFKIKGFKIETVCPHGNPLKERVGYESNQDFFRSIEIANMYKNIGDIYVQLPNMIKNYLYITDAGYGFKYKKAQDKEEEYQSINKIDEILELIKKGYSCVISIHSHRFYSSKFVYKFRTLLFKIVRIIAKTLYKTKIGKKLFNKYYYLAKKI